MKQFAFALTGLMFAVFAAGCRPELAQVQYGSEEAQWAEYVDRSYSGFRPPRTAPPAIVDKVSPKLVEEENRAAAEAEVALPPATEDVVEVETVVDTAAADATGTVTEEVQETETVAVEGPTTEPDAAGTAGSGTVESAAEADAVTYVVKPGDTLSHIAQKFYKSASKYDLILKANQNLLKDPKALRPGMKLQIPQL